MLALHARPGTTSASTACCGPTTCRRSTGEPNDDPSYALQARLHAIGYMQGLREAAMRKREAAA